MAEMAFHGRTLARSQALQLLFQAEAAGRGVEGLLGGDYALSQGPLDPYARELALGADERRPQLDAVIARASDNWSIGRMPSVDRNLLRIALFEILYEPEVATAVAIDECVELAKAFGTDDSGKFVNGVLGRVARELEDGVDVVARAEEERATPTGATGTAEDAADVAPGQEGSGEDGFERWVPDGYEDLDGDEVESGDAARRRRDDWGKPYGYGLELTGGISQPEPSEEDDDWRG